MSVSHAGRSSDAGALGSPQAWQRSFISSSSSRDRLAVVEDVHRPAAAVRERLRRVDADGAVERAEHLRHGVTGGPSAARRGRCWRRPPGPSSARRRRPWRDITGDQWSRPALLLIFGVRPNSPHITVTTSSCHAAVVQVLDQVRDAAVDLRQLPLQRL